MSILQFYTAVGRLDHWVKKIIIGYRYYVTFDKNGNIVDKEYDGWRYTYKHLEDGGTQNLFTFNLLNFYTGYARICFIKIKISNQNWEGEIIGENSNVEVHFYKDGTFCVTDFYGGDAIYPTSQDLNGFFKLFDERVSLRGICRGSDICTDD